MPRSSGCLNRVAFGECLIDLKGSDVAHVPGRRVLGVPIAGVFHGIGLGQYRVEDGLVRQSGREGAPVRGLDEVELGLTDRTE